MLARRLPRLVSCSLRVAAIPYKHFPASNFIYSGTRLVNNKFNQASVRPFSFKNLFKWKPAPPSYEAQLVAACKECNVNQVRLLLEERSAISDLRFEEQSLFIHATATGNMEIVAMMLDKGIDVTQAPHFMAMRNAVENNHMNVVELLLDKGIQVDKRLKLCNCRGAHDYALEIAACKGHLELVKFLLHRGANVKDEPLHGCSVNKGHSRVVELLLKRGASADILANDNYFTPLIAAAYGGNKEMVELLLDAGASVDKEDKHQHTALLRAVETSPYSGVAELLVTRGANVNLANVNGLTPLMKAVEHGAAELFQLLVDHGANIEQQDKYQQTAIFFLFFGYNQQSAEGHLKILKTLVSMGVNFNQINEYGVTPYEKALDSNRSELIQILQELGAKI